MKKKQYYGLKICAICVEPVEGLLSASRVIDRNDVIKATKQEVEEINIADDTGFEVTWE